MFDAQEKKSKKGRKEKLVIFCSRTEQVRVGLRAKKMTNSDSLICYLSGGELEKWIAYFREGEACKVNFRNNVSGGGGEFVNFFVGQGF